MLSRSDVPSVAIPPLRALGFAATLVGAWALGVTVGLRWGDPASVTDVSVLVPAQTLLSTGLFITAHDAMHGTAAPGMPRVNRAIGVVAVALYALFDYDRLVAAHRRHHAAPATGEDPDYHDGSRPGFFWWYAGFVWRYVTTRQLLGMAVVANVFIHVLRIPTSSVLVFWALPALLSTLQLFYFGTFLPHRDPVGGHVGPHRTRATSATRSLPGRLGTLLACYHFGRHLEHHERPWVPWWRLHEVDLDTGRADDRQRR